MLQSMESMRSKSTFDLYGLIRNRGGTTKVGGVRTQDRTRISIVIIAIATNGIKLWKKETKQVCNLNNSTM